ncbi:sigma factor [Virgibacillus sp. YIM 98842]|uniref:sigma factor n=1 Tax=Virgibacillus sp. YIM 98842 TaxID=2663533 RepID=UPI001F092385|nr:sigma factor [Virgibacillus sp. YIM 98842]
MLYYKALSYVGKKEDALDVIQETSCKAFLSIGKLRNPKYFSTWLFRILIHECYRLIKNRNRHSL